DADFEFGSTATQAPPARAAKPAPRPAPAAKAPAPAPARKPAPPARPASQDVWELDEAPAPAKPAAGPLALTLEIDGLTGDVRRAVEALVGKVIELPSLRVRIKGRDLA